MKLTKTQIHYLEDNLTRVCQDRVKEYQNTLGKVSVRDEILKELKEGTIKLLPSKTIIQNLMKSSEGRPTSTYYGSHFDITELISKEDKERIINEVGERNIKSQKFRDTIFKVRQTVLNKIVLEGIDIEQAIKELDKVK